MSPRPKIEEKYSKDRDVLYFVVYQQTDGVGEDEVLQHQLAGVETAHITLHPGGVVNLNIERPGLEHYVLRAAHSNLAGYTPAPSARVKQFILKVKQQLPTP